MPRLLMWIALLGSSAAVPAEASPPSPCQSTVQACLPVCPAGDLSFVVVVRDFLSNIEPGTDVTLDLCSCPDLVLGATDGTEAYVIDPDGCTIVIPNTDITATADFRIRAGGTCAPGSTAVFAKGIPLGCPMAQPPIASPDQNGDLIVDATDRAIAAAKVGSSDLTADLDCDGVVTTADLEVLDLHHGHTSAPQLPASQTWTASLAALLLLGLAAVFARRRSLNS